MKRVFKRLKRTKKVIRYSYYVLILAYLVSFFFFAKNIIVLSGIETLLRIIVLVILVIYFIFYVLYNLLNLLQRKFKGFIITSFITLILIIIFSVASYYIGIVYNELGNIGESEKIEYTSYLITLKDIEFNEESVIGRISNEDDTEGYILAEKLYEENNLENKIEDYDDYVFMLKELYAGNIGAVFVPSNYVIAYSNEEGLESLGVDTKIIYKYSETMKNKDLIEVSDKDFSEPLTFLVMGVDSETNGLDSNAAFNGDTLMIVSFNPETLQTTMVSIPRDTYVPIACNKNNYAKINSAAAYSTSCVIDTVSNFLDVKIDYYAKINFKGVVELVDAVGGVSVDVEAPDFNHHQALGINCNGKFCEQNSNRGTGSKDIIYIDPGVQELNGEEALAYARGRYMYVGGDLDRIKHQQQVVEALANKLVGFSSLADFQDILKAVSNNMATNMERNTILSGYNVIKKMLGNALNGDEFLTINKAYLETYSLYTYVPRQHSYTSAQGFYLDSLEDIQNSLKETLGIEETKVVKTFNFSVNEEYVAYSPGQGLRKKVSSKMLPNFVGKTVTEAEEYCNENGIELNIRYVDPGSEYYNSGVAVGLIGSQSVHADVLISLVDELTVYIVNSAVKEDISNSNSAIEDNNGEKKETGSEGSNADEIDDFVESLLN